MIRIRFVKAEYTEILNCVLLGVAAQHVKTIVNGNNSYKIIEGGFGCQGRLALRTLFGIFVLVIGERFRRKNWHALFQVLTGGGLASFYLCIFFSFQVYYLSTQTVSMLLAIFVTGIAVLMAVEHNAMSIALLALIGGFLSPVLLSTGENHPYALFSYIAILDLVAIGSA